MMHISPSLLFVLLLSCFHQSLGSKKSRACGDGYPSAVLPSGYCAFTFYSNAGEPRGIFVDRDGDGAVLVVDRENRRVIALYDRGKENGAEATNETVLTTPEDFKITHGIVVGAGYLYLSSAKEVWKWKYRNGTVDGKGVRVVKNIPTGGHVTRTLVFHKGDLLVQCGSLENVDTGPERATVKIVEKGQGKDLDWNKLKTFAEGLRNTVGLKTDRKGRLWGVENGRDELVVPGVGDVHQENPCEEVNLITGGKFYGYPFAFSEYKMPRSVSRGRTGQFPQPEIKGKDIVYKGQKVTEKWLRNESNVERPAYCMPGHWAPLGLELRSSGPKKGKYAFPDASDTEDSIFTFSHGSWNADPPVGRLVARIKLHGSDALPKINEDPEIIFGHAGKEAEWDVRPVDGAFANDGTLLFTSDSTGEVIGIRFFENLEGSDDKPCFPGHSQVELEGGERISMEELKTGSALLTASRKGRKTYSDVYMFGHRNADESHEFLEICANNVHDCLWISKDHYVFSPPNRLQTAGSLRTGNYLQLANGTYANIEHIRTRKGKGLFSPITLSGSVVVDGFRVSAYSAVTSPRLAHWTAAPLRALYRLGFYKMADLGGWLHRKSKYNLLRVLGVPQGAVTVPLHGGDL